MAHLIQGKSNQIAESFIQDRYPENTPLVDINFNFFIADNLNSLKRTHCSFHLRYQADDLSQWLISLTKGTDLEPAKQNIFLLTSIAPFLAQEENSLNITSGSCEQLCSGIGELFGKDFTDYISQLVSDKEIILPEKINLIEPFVRNMTTPIFSRQWVIPIQSHAFLNDYRNCFNNSIEYISLMMQQRHYDKEFSKVFCNAFLDDDHSEQHTHKFQLDSHLKSDLQKIYAAGMNEIDINIFKDLNEFKRALESDMSTFIKVNELSRALAHITLREQTFDRQLEGARFSFKAVLINRLRHLELPDSEQIIHALLSEFLPTPDDSCSHPLSPLYSAMLKIELDSQAIMKLLGMEAPENCIDAEKTYRRAMHQLIYEQVIRPDNKTVFLDKIQHIEAPFLKALDVDRHPWLRMALQVLVNALTLIFTFGYANNVHQAATGNFLFFSRPVSAEALMTLDHEMCNFFF